MPQHVGLDRE
jgi:hypothetical protein